MLKGAYQTITMWNKIREGAKDVWYRHVLAGCSFKHKIVRAVSGSTASIANVTAALIPKNPLYKSPSEWAAGDKSAFFTLQAGDLIALGEQAIEITGVTPNTESAVRTRLLPDVFTVKAVQDNTAGYKRGGHYYVEGV